MGGKSELKRKLTFLKNDNGFNKNVYFSTIWGLDGLFIILETKRENKQMLDSKG